MSNIEFELISPYRLKETCQTDWRCFICPIEKKEKLQNLFSKKSMLTCCILSQYFMILNLQVYWAGGWQD